MHMHFTTGKEPTVSFSCVVLCYVVCCTLASCPLLTVDFLPARICQGAHVCEGMYDEMLLHAWAFLGCG